jgi:hypothetical protein
MTPERLRTKILSSSPSPLRGKGNTVPVNKREGAFDVSTELSGFGLQGVMATEDELADLVAELGLDGDEAGDLVKGLSVDAAVKSGDNASEDNNKAPEEIPEATASVSPPVIAKDNSVEDNTAEVNEQSSSEPSVGVSGEHESEAAT